jgi:GNAT superfamily N-acetyltransferase
METTNQDLHFRALVEADIPAVLDLTSTIWGGHDYMPMVIEEWVGTGLDKAYMFGAFDDEETANLVGFGRILWHSADMAWFEGVRVRPDRQQSGIGSAIFAHGIEYATGAGAKVIRFDTGLRNMGSIALGRQYGFTEIYKLVGGYVGREEFLAGEFATEDVEEIPPEAALDRLKEVESPPIDMLCVGPEFVPLDPAWIEGEPLLFVAIEGAVASIRRWDPQGIRQDMRPNVQRMVINGNGEAIVKLAIACAAKAFEDPAIELVSFLCPEVAIDGLVDAGFHREDMYSGLVLYEKSLL